VPSWAHRLKEAGHDVSSIGKLHFRSSDDDNGFTDEVMPMHVVDGRGDALGWLRDPLPVRKAALKLGRCRARRFELSAIRRQDHRRGDRLAESACRNA